jgi:hypothetical protein
METLATQTKKTKKSKQLSQPVTTTEVKEPVASPPPQVLPQVQQQRPTQTSEPAQGETQTVQSQQEQKEIRLVDIPITDENIALNVMVGFLNVAHKRGVFTIDESAKIWECISKFQKP